MARNKKLDDSTICWIIEVQPNGGKLKPCGIRFISIQQWRELYNPDFDINQKSRVDSAIVDEKSYMLITPQAKPAMHGKINNLIFEYNNDDDKISMYRKNLVDFSNSESQSKSSNADRDYLITIAKSDNDLVMRRKSMYINMQTSIVYMLNKMIEMDAEIGHKWKLPDYYSCLLYALTEANEYLESILLSVRDQDSRNNKSQDDFNSATELFDVSMMILRSVMGLLKSYGLDMSKSIYYLNRSVVDYYESMSGYYGDERQKDYTDYLEYLYTDEPVSLILYITDILDAFEDIDQYNASNELPKDLTQNVVPILDYIINHPIMQYNGQTYLDIGEAKLEKIRLKNA